MVTGRHLNNSEQSLMNVTTQEVISSPDNATSCDAYQFQVTAKNPAGVTSSISIFSSFPSLPMPIAEGTVQDFMTKVASGVVLRIKINVSTT
jgi:hypothetical protein